MVKINNLDTLFGVRNTINSNFEAAEEGTGQIRNVLEEGTGLGIADYSMLTLDHQISISDVYMGDIYADKYTEGIIQQEENPAEDRLISEVFSGQGNDLVNFYEE